LEILVLQIVELTDHISYLYTQKCQRSSSLGRALENVAFVFCTYVSHSTRENVKGHRVPPVSSGPEGCTGSITVFPTSLQT
jgi:hypothetical protein